MTMWGNFEFTRGDVVIYRGRKYLVRWVEDGIATLLNDEDDILYVAVDLIAEVYTD
jgi:hypothetical protein